MALRAAGFQLDEGCTRVLGSPVGEVDACAAWVLKKVEGWTQFWQRVRHDALRPGTALMILAKCGNVKFEHLAASLHPDVTRGAADIFDDAVDSALRHILGIRKQFVDKNVLRSTFGVMPYTVVAETLYRCTVDRVEHRSTSVKHALAEKLNHHYATLTNLPFIEQHVRAVQGVTASDMMYSSAPVPSKIVSQHHFAQGLRLRVGALPGHMPTQCDCGYIFGTLPEQHSAICHLLNCDNNTKVNKTTRHNRVVDAIADVLALYNVTSTRSCKNLDTTKERIPDLRVFLRKEIIIDVTIIDDVHGTAEHFEEAVKIKHSKYDSLAEQLGMAFFPVAMSAYGKLGREAWDFVREVSYAVPYHRRAKFKRDLRCAMQHALLHGTSEVIDEVMKRLSGTGNWLL